MKPANSPLAHLTSKERQTLVRPAVAIAIVVLSSVLLQSLNPSLDKEARMTGLGVGILGIFYAILLHQYFFPLARRYQPLHWIFAVAHGAGNAILPALIPISPVAISAILAVVVITITSLLGGRWPTYLFILIYTGLSYTVFKPVMPPNAFNDIDALILPFASIIIIETVLRLGETINARVTRLEAINQVTRKITTTIEIHQVVSLVSAAIQDTLLADTYFVALLDERNREDITEETPISLELFYDDGEFFPKQMIPLGNGPGGWVIRHCESLLINDLRIEAEALGIELRIVGKRKANLSWIGVPLSVGEHLLGTIGAGAYRRGAFDVNDLEILESVAYQAALVIDNAYHHTEVEEQSRRDSLTGTYNHRHFLTRLEEETNKSKQGKYPLALIMLDVDFFKRYNDQYGHLLGDQVLVELTRTMQEHTKDGDFIGRWGGEEFGIGLPKADGLEAYEVARRIQDALSKLTLTNRDGKSVPPPTISQGIAVCPLETDVMEALIHLADKRLYVAKERGRDQIEPSVEHWGNSQD